MVFFETSFMEGAMNIIVIDGSGNVEHADVVGYSRSQSRKTLFWIERCLRQEHPDYFNWSSRFCLPNWLKPRGSNIYYPNFWSAVVGEFGKEIPGSRWSNETGEGASYRLRVAGRWIRFHFT